MGVQVLPHLSTETPANTVSDTQLVRAAQVLDPKLMAPAYDQKAASEDLQLANLILKNPGCYAHSMVCWARKITWQS
jgi:hypothetical protein